MWVSLAISQIGREEEEVENDERVKSKISFPVNFLGPNRVRCGWWGGVRIGRRTGNFSIIFISFYLWLNFLNLMIGLSSSLLRFGYRLLTFYLSPMPSFFPSDSIHQCFKKIYGLIIAVGRLHTFMCVAEIYEAYRDGPYIHFRLL